MHDTTKELGRAFAAVRMRLREARLSLAIADAAQKKATAQVVDNEKKLSRAMDAARDVAEAGIEYAKAVAALEASKERHAECGRMLEAVEMEDAQLLRALVDSVAEVPE